MIQTIERWVHTAFVELGRSVAFLKTHHDYPELCDEPDFHRDGDTQWCESCGWHVEFYPDRIKVRYQWRIE